MDSKLFGLLIAYLFSVLQCSEVQALPPSPASNQTVSERSIFENILTPRKPLPFAALGVNAFANDQRFGSIRSQFREVRNILKLKDVRILFAWNDQIQPTPSSQIFWGFYDEIAESLPKDMRAVVVLTGVPSWMKLSSNWKDGNPRKTFIEKWVIPVTTRYKTNGKLATFQIWNEPNNPSFSENATLAVLDSPTNYVELQAIAYSAIKDIAPRRRVIPGATTAIAQNFPSTLNYNKSLVAAGLLEFADVFTIHYYGSNVDKVLLPNGIKDFLNSLLKPIWITEIGKQGTTSQLEYTQRYIPFLVKSAPKIQKIFLYQFTEATPAQSTYGLRNLTPGKLLSDLYIHLRDRKKDTIVICKSPCQ